MNSKNSIHSRLMARHRIVEQAQEQFFAHGFMSVSMDNIAAILGMSKKTLYHHFPSKNRLIEATMEEYIITAIQRYKQIMNSPLEYVDKLYTTMRLVGNTFMKMGKQYRIDLRSRRPDIWRRVDEIRMTTVFSNFKTFITMGIENGIVKSDVHPEMLLIAYISALQGVDESSVLVNGMLSSDDAFESITRIMLDGILTEKAWQ
jgi:AcrR family transcriptional regulator